MTKDRRINAILFALLAAVFYAINVPLSKVLMQRVGDTTMAALLYMGAGKVRLHAGKKHIQALIVCISLEG